MHNIRFGTMMAPLFNPFELLAAAPDDPWLSKSEVIECSYCINAFVLKTLGKSGIP